MFFTKATMRLTISTDGSGATVAGIMLTSLSVCLESSVTFLRRVSFILVLSIIFCQFKKTDPIIPLDSFVLIAETAGEEYRNRSPLALIGIDGDIAIQGINNGLTDAESQT